MVRALLTACGLFSALPSVATGSLDELALVQRSARSEVVSADAGRSLHITPQGPVVETKMGPLLGVEMDDHIAFRGIPYAEPPRRFDPAVAKQPWAPHTLDARAYKHGCVGSSVTTVETEDCLNLNVWLPKGEHSNMPVIVYFHGGLNMHGAGSEMLRQGDGITQSAKYPTIFVNMDYRLGIFGWIYGEKGSNVTNNIGTRDQQAALRWVHENIASFGGDPNQVALQGQSEGAGNIMDHLVSPYSFGLFSRAIFHSPPAEVWSEESNRQRTAAILRKMDCDRDTMQGSIACLRRISAERIWKSDWSPEDLSRNPFSPTWLAAAGNMLGFLIKQDPKRAINFLGWHAVVDGDIIPDNIHNLISSGNWNKVPVLMTISRNESMGCIPGKDSQVTRGMLTSILKQMVNEDDIDQLMEDYNTSLMESGIFGTSKYELLHQMVTDKMWTCEAWSLVEEITRGGGTAQLGGFWHSPQWDPVGSQTNAACTQGATCHAAEMLYSLPQGHGRGVPSFMKEEVQFMERYRDEVLAFVHGHTSAWDVYKPDHQVITLYDKGGARVQEGYRKKQCRILDKSVSIGMPMHMRRRASGE